MRTPRRDEEIPDFWRDLGLPGLIDVHVHFMPDRVLRKVWAFFDNVRMPDGGRWPIAYRDAEERRLQLLRAFGVRSFPSLVYAHRPGMAAWLNCWAADFAKATPDCVHSATFFCEPQADDYVAEALERGARIFKVHLSVGDFDPRDQLLAPVWRRLAAAGVPVVTHAGSGPDPGRYTGPEVFADVLAAHPELVAVIAHMGMPEYKSFLTLALRYEHVHLDTTMAFTPFIERLAPFPPELVDVLGRFVDRVVLGSDFPNIPYPYAQQLASLVELGLGEDWLRAVCWHNGARLLGKG